MPSSLSSSWSASSSSWTTPYSSSSLLHLCCIRPEISIESQSWLSYFWAAMASSSLLCTLPNTAAKMVSIVLITFCPNDNGGARPPLVVGRHLHRIMDGAQRVESRGFGRKLRFIQIRTHQLSSHWIARINSPSQIWALEIWSQPERDTKETSEAWDLILPLI